MRFSFLSSQFKSSWWLQWIILFRRVYSVAVGLFVFPHHRTHVHTHFISFMGIVTIFKLIIRFGHLLTYDKIVPQRNKSNRSVYFSRGRGGERRASHAHRRGFFFFFIVFLNVVHKYVHVIFH